jgi:hypothetical protein
VRRNRAQRLVVERGHIEARRGGRPAPGELLAVGDHHRQGDVVVALGEPAQDLLAGVIEALDVLEHQRHRVLAGGGAQEAQRRRDQLAAPDRRLEIGELRGLAEQLADAGDVAARQPEAEGGALELLDRAHRGQAEHRGGDRADRIERRGQAGGIRPALEDGDVGGGRDPLVGLGEQAALAGAGRAHQLQQRLALAAGEVADQRGEDIAAADHRQRQDPDRRGLAIDLVRGRRRRQLGGGLEGDARLSAFRTKAEARRRRRPAGRAQHVVVAGALAQRQDGGAHLGGGRVAIGGVLGQRPGADRVEAGRDVALGGAHRRRHRLALDLAAEHLDRRAADERSLSAQQLVEHDAGGVEVARDARRGPADQLGRHVLGGAADVAFLAGAARRIDQAGDAEVDDLHRGPAAAPLIDDDVVGLDVGVDHAGEVRLLEAAQHLAHDVDQVLAGERAARHQLGQRRAGQVLHHQVQQAVEALAVVDDRDRVGMVEPRRRQRLVVEALDQLGVGGQLLGEDLDRDGASQRDLVGLVDRTRAADADARAQPELFGEHAPGQLMGSLLRAHDDIIEAGPRRATIARPPRGLAIARAECPSGVPA